MGNLNGNYSNRECRSCKRLLPQEKHFYKHKGRFDTKCKKCRIKAVSKWKRANRERINNRRREMAHKDGWPKIKKTTEERYEYYKKTIARNRRILKKKLNSSTCTICTSASPKLIAHYQGKAVTGMLERSVESLEHILSKAEYVCKPCTLRERKELWVSQYDPNEIRECGTCRKKKPLRDFTQTPNPARIKTCRACTKNAAVTRKAKRKAYIEELKRNPCTDCGNIYDSIAMDFDHLPEYEKVNTISRLMRTGSMKKLKKELQKCELVCANCHRIRTQKRSKSI